MRTLKDRSQMRKIYCGGERIGNIKPGLCKGYTYISVGGIYMLHC